MLTTAQLAALKAAILAETDPAVVTARAARDDGVIAAFYNTAAPGPVKMWRNDISVTEVVEATIDNLATFDGLSAGKRDAWGYMTRMTSLDFTRNKIRSGVGAVWAATQRDAILNSIGTRNAKRCELLFGTADVTEGGVTAKKCDFIGTLAVGDVSDALNS